MSDVDGSAAEMHSTVMSYSGVESGYNSLADSYHIGSDETTGSVMRVHIGTGEAPT